MKSLLDHRDDPEIQEILQKLKSGELSVNTGREDYIWTQEQKDELTKVMNSIFKENHHGE